MPNKKYENPREKVQAFEHNSQLVMAQNAAMRRNWQQGTLNSTPGSNKPSNALRTYTPSKDESIKERIQAAARICKGLTTVDMENLIKDSGTSGTTIKKDNTHMTIMALTHSDTLCSRPGAKFKAIVVDHTDPDWEDQDKRFVQIAKDEEVETVLEAVQTLMFHCIKSLSFAQKLEGTRV